MYKELAKKYYAGHKEFDKAFAAGTAMDNALKLESTKGGHTHCHFMLGNYLKYFVYDRLPENRKTS
jgi:hypothetical protein